MTTDRGTIWQADIVEDMKTKFCIALISLAAAWAPAQTNNLTALLQQGLFEEQASRNLDAAITDYQALATQFDKDRQIAATAVFRLGECYRAQGKTNEAALQYQRILRDFSDQTTLATLSRQDLAGMGLGAGKTEAAALAENADAQLLKKLEGRGQDELEKLLPTLMPSTTLDTLVRERNLVKIQRAKQVVDYSANSIQVMRLDTELKAYDQQIADTISGMMQALKLRAEISAPSPALKRSDLVDLAVPSEEDQEIARIQQMIQNSPDLINAPGEGGATPLQAAAALGRLKVVNFLLDHGAAINAGSFPALNRAADSGNRAMVELLLRRGADVDVAEPNGQTALHRASLHGYLSVVDALLAARPDVNAHTSNRQTPLTMAVENRAAFVAATLLAHGADLNYIRGAPSHFNSSIDRKADGTPLQIAVALNDEAMVTMLLTNQPDLTLRNHSGESALDIAAIQGETSIARRLIAAGAAVNIVKAEDQGKASPLQLAAASGAKEVVALLLEHGANPSVPDANGMTPLMAAVTSNSGSASDIISLLLSHKADPNVAYKDGDSSLIIAIQRQNLAAVKALLNGGANPDLPNRSGYPPLVLAVDSNSGNKDMVTALIAAKADVNTPDSYGKAPLHWAAEKNRPDLVSLLVKAGADVNQRTKGGGTPLDYARPYSRPADQIRPTIGVALPLSYQWQNSADGSETTNASTVADILHRSGALDELPDFTRIRITRQGVSQPLTVFGKGEALTNRFTLLETVMRFYSRSQVLIAGNSGGNEAWRALPFPDFARIIIHRPGQKIGSKEQELKVNLLDLSNRVDCAQDVPVQFGDVIEIPESVHALNAAMPNPVREMEGRSATFEERMQAIQTAAGSPGPHPTVNPYQASTGCLQKSVQLVVAGETTAFKVDSWKEGFLKEALGKTEARSALRSSSDLSRVKVTRKTGNAAKPVIFTVDVSDNSRDDALWLQDGDVIEVPDKP